MVRPFLGSEWAEAVTFIKVAWLGEGGGSLPNMVRGVPRTELTVANKKMKKEKIIKNT